MFSVNGKLLLVILNCISVFPRSTCVLILQGIMLLQSDLDSLLSYENLESETQFQQMCGNEI